MTGRFVTACGVGVVALALVTGVVAPGIAAQKSARSEQRPREPSAKQTQATRVVVYQSPT